MLRVFQPRNMLRLAVLLMVLAGALFVMHAPVETERHSVGDLINHDIYGRTDFTYVDAAATEQARDSARQETPGVFERQTERIERLREEFITLMTAASEAARPPSPPAPTPADVPSPPAATESPEQPSAETPESAESSAVAPGENQADGPGAAETPAASSQASPEAESRNQDESASEASPTPAPVQEASPTPPAPPPAPTVSAQRREQLLQQWEISEAMFEELKRVASNPDQREAAVYRFNRFLSAVQNLDILSGSDFFSPETTNKGILVMTESGDPQRREYESLLNAENTERIRVALSGPFSREFTGEIFSGRLRVNLLDRVVRGVGPTLRLNQEQTQQIQQQRASAVEPLTRSFKQGELLVAAGSRLTASQQARLEAHDAALESRIPWWQHVLRVAASVLLTTALLLVLIGYIMLSERRIIGRAARAFVLGALILSVLIVARFFQLQQPMALFPLTTAAMIVAIAYNRQFAIVFTWATVLLAVLVMRQGFDSVLLMVIGTSAAIMQLGEIRNRLKLIRVGFVTGLVYFILYWAQMVWSWNTNLTGELLDDTLAGSGLAMASGLLSGFIILGVLPFIERIFNIVTSISLLELCDVNQPALRKLAIEAPGSYSHSLLLGTLVEPAAEAIGAGGLLARVGAYFHDIGKANKPHYFTENRNQLGDAPDHDRLTPQMSKIIITGHIKDGLDMARHYGLPKVVQQFIAEHHGTTIIEYFYHEARKGGGGTDVAESEFRYAGPKPQRKETAILMLADGCEGAVRSIKDPTPSKIEDKVHEIVMKRLLDGQLNESGLTLNEVWTIEQSLKKSLISVYHGRIAYPSAEEIRGAGGTGGGSGREGRQENGGVEPAGEDGDKSRPPAAPGPRQQNDNKETDAGKEQ